ncbi:AraC family transcriptional regulator [Anaerosolibacter carboniphilus]|uniref:AraC family transcriptional regulator n=1 Tax=Anaerosolibacter carboniphilus TaxID=1417629 RepID=A0A841L6R3_9FIRM|nr:AraC family transcriptional regulator [Anaerosolibacter carboniphilus]MBB6217965.1 AraC family transcriptional regulator [Anaerosolibacter carboniphilus]
MNYIALMNEVIDYIEENLNTAINIDELANRFCVSKYYFIRIFKAVTNYTVKEYVDKRRITEAAKELIKNKKNIIDIAFEFGYESHETFTRQFKRIFSITPMELKKKGAIIFGYEKIIIVERDFKNLNKDLVVDFQVVHEKELKLLGKMTQFDPSNEQSIAELTPFVESFVSDYIEKRNICRMYNVVMNQNEISQFGYFTAFKYQDNIQEVDLGEMVIQETTYAVFKYRADLGEIHRTVMNDICRTIVISDLSFNKIGIEFFLVFEEDYFETNEYTIYVPVKK